MCQAGIIAAPGLYALDNMIDRLDQDHKNAKRIANAIAAMESPIISTKMDSIESNIIMMSVPSGLADTVCKRLAEVSEKEESELGSSTSVLALVLSDIQVRLVLHCDISDKMASKAAEKICYVVKGRP